MERVDDVYVNEHDREDESLFIMSFHDSSVEFAVDGDHSGGTVFPEESQRHAWAWQAQFSMRSGRFSTEAPRFSSTPCII